MWRGERLFGPGSVSDMETPQDTEGARCRRAEPGPSPSAFCPRHLKAESPSVCCVPGSDTDLTLSFGAQLANLCLCQAQGFHTVTGTDTTAPLQPSGKHNVALCSPGAAALSLPFSSGTPPLEAAWLSLCPFYSRKALAIRSL